jgi:hypothetical protein
MLFGLQYPSRLHVCNHHLYEYEYIELTKLPQVDSHVQIFERESYCPITWDTTTVRRHNFVERVDEIAVLVS